MADNITITQGAGTTMGTDEIGGVHYQRVKLISGVDGTNDGDIDETNPLPVRGGGIVIAQTPTITAGAYAAKEAVGGKLTFVNAAKISGGKGIINTLVIVDDGDVEANLELWLFNQDFTASSDNAAFDPSDADLENLVGVIPISTSNYFSANDNGAAVVPGVGIEYHLTGTSLYGQLKCCATPTYAATDGLTIKLAVEYLD